MTRIGRAARTSSSSASHVWRTRFHAARDVIGKTLIVNSVPREIVGVMPERFRLPRGRHAAVAPREARSEQRHVIGDFSYSGVARLAPRRDTRGRAARARDGAAKSGRVVPATGVWNGDCGVARSGQPQARRYSVARRGHQRNRAHALDARRGGGPRAARRVGPTSPISC